MEITGILVGAKIVKGMLNVVIDVIDDPAKPSRQKKYKVRSDRISEQELSEMAGKVITATLVGGFIDNIW